jgi:hypothetical protein
MYCGARLETLEQPLRYEDQCYERCFREGERDLIHEAERRKENQ